MEPIYIDRNSIDEVPLVERGRLPANGYRYTWEDDALNIEMRKHETYVSGGTIPRKNDTRRCKGFSRTYMRPCRKWSAKNVEGKHLNFCYEHLQVSQAPRGVFLTAHAIVARTSKNTRHGAYSELLKLQIIEGLKLNADPKSRTTLQNMLEVMNGVDTEDLSGPLNGSMQLIMGLTASLLQKHATGQIGFDDYLTGTVVLTEMLRKLASAKHEIVGTADDEKERAIQHALEEQGLVGEEPQDDLVWSEDQGLWSGIEASNERGGTATDIVGAGEGSTGTWGNNDTTVE